MAFFDTVKNILGKIFGGSASSIGTGDAISGTNIGAVVKGVGNNVNVDKVINASDGGCVNIINTDIDAIVDKLREAVQINRGENCADELLRAEEQLKQVRQHLCEIEKSAGARVKSEIESAVNTGDLHGLLRVFSLEISRLEDGGGQSAYTVEQLLKDKAVVAKILGEYVQAEKSLVKLLGVDGARDEGEIELASLYLDMGKLSDARVMLESLEQRCADQRDLAVIYNNLVIVYIKSGLLNEAREASCKALKINTALGRLGGIAVQLSNQGRLMLIEGAYEQAKAKFMESLDIEKSLHSTIGQAQELGGLARAMLLSGEFAEAEDLAAQSYELSRKSKYLSGEFWALLCLAEVAVEARNFDLASSRLRDAESLISGKPMPSAEVDLLEAKGGLSVRQGHFVDAIQFYKESFRFAKETGDLYATFQQAFRIARLAIHQGDFSLAAEYIEYFEQSEGGQCDSFKIAAISLRASIALLKGDVDGARELVFGSSLIQRNGVDVRVIDELYLVRARVQFELRDWKGVVESSAFLLERESDLSVIVLTTLYDMLGAAYRGLDKLDVSMHYYQRSYDLECELVRPREMVVSMLNLGIIHSLSRQFQHAEEWLSRAEDLARDSDLPDLVFAAKKELAVVQCKAREKGGNK